MQNETAGVIDGATGAKPDSARRGHRLHLELAQQILEARTFDGAIDHDPHCPVLGVSAHVNHALSEARIGHRGHGDQ